MIKPYLAMCMQPPIHLARSRQDVAENIKRIADMIGLSVFLHLRKVCPPQDAILPPTSEAANRVFDTCSVLSPKP